MLFLELQTSSESRKVNNPSVDGGMEEGREDNVTQEEEKSERKKPLPSLGSSIQLKRMSASVSLSSSLSSGINELNQTQVWKMLGNYTCLISHILNRDLVI